MSKVEALKLASLIFLNLYQLPDFLISDRYDGKQSHALYNFSA